MPVGLPVLGANCETARHDPPGFAAASPQPLYPGYWRGEDGPAKAVSSKRSASGAIDNREWLAGAREERAGEIPAAHQQVRAALLEDPADAIVPYVVNREVLPHVIIGIPIIVLADVIWILRE